uniref:Uncharacterized protein n=1 Tax=Oryza sativa subsp. japonica TaxID=39947 RepID=Q2QVN4_ORYSJ|nr:hypothetical protein LOC_Os12g12220 [Oryza sativa Japonica Group]
MAIFKKDGTAVLFVMVTAMFLSSWQAAFHYKLSCANLPKCTEHACVADCNRRGFQLSRSRPPLQDRQINKGVEA